MDTSLLAGASAGLAGKCTQISNYLNALKDASNDVRVFALEVDQLSRALGGLATGLNDAAATKYDFEAKTGFEGQHWRNVRLVLDDCKGTVTALNEILEKAKGKEHRILKFRNKAVNNVDVTTDEMVLIKKQLGAYRRTLQMSSQLLALYFFNRKFDCTDSRSSLKTTTVATSALSSQLAALTLEHQQTTQVVSHLKEESSDFHHRRVIDDLQECLKSAGDITSSALITLDTQFTTKSSEQPGDQIAKTVVDSSVPEAPPGLTASSQVSQPSTTGQVTIPALPLRKQADSVPKTANDVPQTVQSAAPVRAFEELAITDPFQLRVDDSAAVKDWKNLINTNPENLGFYKQLANAHKQEGNIDRELAVRKATLLKFQLEKKTSGVEAFTLPEELAEALQRKGDDDEEIAVWEELVAKDPMLHTWRNQLQAAYTRHGMYGDAIRTWGEWVKKFPLNCHYSSELAEIFTLKGDSDEAFEFWKQLVDRAPMNHKARHELQTLCTRNGDRFLDRGLSIWKDLVRQYPGNFHYAPELMTMLDTKGDEKDTFVFWKEIVDKHPAEAIMGNWQYLGTAYQLRDPAAAVEYWKEHLYERKGDLKWQEPLAQALEYLGDIELKISVWKDCLEKFPSAFYLCDKLFDALEGKGAFDEAIQIGKELLRKFPAKYEWQECLSKALDWKGDVAGEIDTWRELVRLNPSVASLQERLTTANQKQ